MIVQILAATADPTDQASSSPLPGSMSGEQWAANLLQGSVGAIISIIGLFLVFWFTRNHERDLNASTQRAEKERATEERTLTNVSKVSQMYISIDVHSFDEKITDLFEFVNSLVMFSFQEGRDHEGAADWAMEKAIQINSAIYANKDIQIIMRVSARAVGTLTAWTRSGCPQDMLSEEIAISQKKEWEGSEGIDPSLAVTWTDLKSTDSDVRAEAHRRMYLWND